MISHTTLMFSFAALIALLLLCFFFSGSETGMMSINRYRIRHLAKKGNKRALRVLKLLEHPEQLLSMIVTGNTCATIIASSLLTFIAEKFWGNIGVAVATAALALIILFFCEALPKSIAALNPERFALPATFLLRWFMVLFAPLIWLVNMLVRGLLKCFRISSTQRNDHLTPDELYTLIKDAGSQIPDSYQNMLLQILDLERLTVADIMIPRSDLIGIDMEDPTDQILEQLINSPYRYLPVYEKDFNEVLGIVKIREALPALHETPHWSKKNLMKLLNPPYAVPENTSLYQQLMNFRRAKKRSALVVDEYGEILGMITLEDLLEEIVGEFTTDFMELHPDIVPELNGSYLINGQASLREINRFFHWHLPLDNQKTIGGYIINYLQTIPESGTCLVLNNQRMEVLQVAENRIKTIRFLPH